MEWHNVKDKGDKTLYKRMPERYFDNRTYDDTTASYTDPEIKSEYKNIKQYYDYLTPNEQQIIKLYYRDSYSQKEIAKELNYKTQAAISHRLRIIRKRLKFLIENKYLDNFDFTELKNFYGRIDLALIESMISTTCLSATVNNLQNVFPEYAFDHNSVHYLWKRVRIKMTKAASKYQSLQKYKKLFDLIEKNKGILANVKHKRHNYIRGC